MLMQQLKNRFFSQSGNTLIIVLVVLVIVGVGALAYLSGQMQKPDTDISDLELTQASSPQLAAEQAVNMNGTESDEASQTPSEPEQTGDNNPVVARVNGEEIKRSDVFTFLQTLPEQSRQVPLEQLFPLGLEQVINAKLINEKTENVNVSSSSEYKEQLELAKKQIARNVYLQKEAEKEVTSENLQTAYKNYVANFSQVEEVKARHILVQDKSAADDLIEKIKAGEDFAALAAEHSSDPTSAKGGDLGYFLKSDVVPEFGEAAFSSDIGKLISAPVQTQFGFHVIEVLDKRIRPPADFDTVRPFLEAQIRREALENLVQGWRDQANIERYTINGQPPEPAAGDAAQE